jgi:hypothetical protein
MIKDEEIQILKQKMDDMAEEFSQMLQVINYLSIHLLLSTLYYTEALTLQFSWIVAFY